MKIPVFHVIALALCATAVTAQPIESFTHVLPVTRKGGDGLQRVVLPPAVHQGAARADLGDLRVFNARGEQVPFANASAPRSTDAAPARHALPYFPLTRAVERTDSDTLNLQVRQQKDGTLISLNSRFTGDARAAPLSAEVRRALTGYIVDASRLNPDITAIDARPAPMLMSALVFDWEVSEDSRSGRVRIESSDDLKSWTTLVADGALIDLEHGGQRLTQKRVEIATTQARYFRLTWADKPFALKSLTAESLTARPPPALMRQIVSPMASQPEGLKPGEVVFDLGGRFPVEQLKLLLPEANTVAPVRIFARSDDKLAWQQVENATFYRLNRDGAELIAPPIKFASRNERFWKIAVDPRAGGVGRGVLQVEVGWQPRSIVFASRGEGPFRLAWGNAEAAPAQLALPALMPDYRVDSEYSLPVAETGEPARQTLTPPTAVSKLAKAFTWKQAVLWLVLLLGVGALGVMAWRLNAQMGTPAGSSRKDAG